MTRQGSSTFRSVIGLLIAALCVLTWGPQAPLLRAQDKPQEKPRAEPAPAPTPLKVTVVISRMQGEKKTSNLPFVLSVGTTGRSSVRMMSDVPVPAGVTATAKDGSITTPGFTYRTLGTQIDVNAGALQDDGRVMIQLTVSDTQLPGDAGGPETGMMRGIPRLQNFQSTANLLLRDGQTIQYTAATDKISGEVIRVDVTLDVLK